MGAADTMQVAKDRRYAGAFDNKSWNHVLHAMTIAKKAVYFIVQGSGRDRDRLFDVNPESLYMNKLMMTPDRMRKAVS